MEKQLKNDLGNVGIGDEREELKMENPQRFDLKKNVYQIKKKNLPEEKSPKQQSPRYSSL